MIYEIYQTEKTKSTRNDKEFEFGVWYSTGKPAWNQSKWWQRLLTKIRNYCNFMKVERKEQPTQEDIEFAEEAEKAKRIAFEESRGCEI